MFRQTLRSATKRLRFWRRRLLWGRLFYTLVERHAAVILALILLALFVSRPR